MTDTPKLPLITLADGKKWLHRQWIFARNRHELLLFRQWACRVRK